MRASKLEYCKWQQNNFQFVAKDTERLNFKSMTYKWIAEMNDKKVIKSDSSIHVFHISFAIYAYFINIQTI